MANVLKMEKQILVQQLLDLGWSYRRIQAETGIRRETVAKYDPDHPNDRTTASKPAKVPTDPSAGKRLNCLPGCDGQKPDSECSADESSAVPTGNILRKPTRTSLAAVHDKLIQQKLSQGLTAKRIYQDLVSEQGFRGSYDSVKRYVRKLVAKHPRVFARIHSLPGEEAQVDFGKGAPTLKDGRWVRPWLFKMVLSYSRHSYEEVVWKQDIESFIRCHQHAFQSFGGVPRLVRLDNLKAGVLVAHLYVPELNPVYAAFARHAGFVPLPCLPRRPEHKGKTESGVGYTKNNALKACKFHSLEAQNEHLRRWNRSWARTRIHGTTKKQVWALFTQVERPALQPLPERPFGLFKVARRTMHRDGHIEVDRAYYSVPHRFVGQTLTVHYNTVWVKAFSGSQRVAFHRKVEPGRFKTEKAHLPAEKSLSAEEFTQRLLERCGQIGPQCRLWALKALKVRRQLALRPIQGVLRLGQKYSADKVNQACAQAMKMGSLRYHTIRLFCDQEQPTLGNGPELLCQHDLIRSLHEYGDYLEALAQQT